MAHEHSHAEGGNEKALLLTSVYLVTEVGAAKRAILEWLMFGRKSCLAIVDWPIAL